jgi:hypothetical protein
MSALTSELGAHFEEVVYVISVEDRSRHLCREEVVDGMTLKVVTKPQFDALAKDCDVLFVRNLPMFIPPKNVVSIYYGASTKINPNNPKNWSAILYCTGRGGGINAHKWVKGGASSMWFPDRETEKEYDFVCFARPGKDTKVMLKLAEKFDDKKFLVTGLRRKTLLPLNIDLVPWEVDQVILRSYLHKSKWAVALACSSGEGWPMSTQLEYALSGVPFVYDPRFVFNDGYYVNKQTSVSFDKFDFDAWEEMSLKAETYALEKLTAKASADSLMGIINKVRKT